MLPFVASAVCVVLSLSYSAAQDPDQDEERAYARFEARNTLRENCLICHSDGLISSQRLTEKQWKASVEKMIGWGAPVPKERVEPLIAYLAAEYPSTRARVQPARETLRQVAPVLAPSALPATAKPEGGAKLYAMNCANCHGLDAQGAELGPNLVERPVLLLVPEFHQVVSEGRNRMPGNAAVLTESQQQDILAWLRTLRYVPKRL
jgi:mono/diheme cytochrome c family protein